MGNVTLRTIADAVGVSKMTVSNAFSRPDQLSEDLRLRILSVATDLGYSGPDASARALARGRSGTIGLLLTDSPADAFRDDVAVGFVASIARAMSERALSLVLLSGTSSGTHIPAQDTAMDGAIVYGCSPTGEAVAWLTRRGLPKVLVDQPRRPRVSSVNVDDRGGATLAGRLVRELGHRRVALIAPDPDWLASAQERLAGWADGLGDIPAVVEVLTGAARHEQALEVARRLLTSRRPPTAVLCYSDVIAADVLAVARELGLEVGRDLSVVGFDDNPIASRTVPALTTVRQDLAAKGGAAVRLLFRAMDARERGERIRAQHVLLGTELVIRDSTGPAPS